MPENHGVPGSNPGPATLNFWRFAGKMTTTQRSRGLPQGSVDAVWQQPILKLGLWGSSLIPEKVPNLGKKLRHLLAREARPSDRDRRPHPNQGQQPVERGIE
jgi:hypothetical protein